MPPEEFDLRPQRQKDTFVNHPTPAPAPTAPVVDQALIAAGVEQYFDGNIYGFAIAFEEARLKVDKLKKFVGVITEVKKEQSSQRGVITLHTGTEQVRPGVPAGHEQVRTDRTDSGGSGRALALKARSLIGHRVLVYVEVEEFIKKDKTPGKARVLRHVEDLGLAQG